MVLEPKLKGHFLNLYHMALSDAEVDTRELEMLYSIGEEKGISRDEILEVVINPDAVKFKAPDNILDKIENLYDLARIALADQKIDDSERRVMEMFCLKFGFQQENVPAITQFMFESVQKEMSKEEVFKIVSENA